MIFKNGLPYQLTTPEGRAVYNNGVWSYEFDYNDHLGNTRVSFKEVAGALVKTAETAFDPYGVKLPIGVNNATQNRWEMQGKEKESTFGLNRINFGNRTMNPTTGIFDRIDRFSEKYTNLSPYQVSANNPVNFIDINGDSLLIQHKGESILYENGNLYWANSGMKSYDGKAYNKKGELKGFVKNSVDALDKIGNGGEKGKELINDLQNYDNYVTIKEGVNQTRGVRVSWDSNSSNGGLDEMGSTSRPSFIGLAHELAHAHDYITDGAASPLTWYTYPDGQTSSFAEVYASHYENMIRGENKLSLRKYYSPNKNENLRLIDSQGNSLWFLNKNFKPYKYK